MKNRLRNKSGVIILVFSLLLSNCFSPSEESGFHALVGKATLENSIDHSEIEIFFSDFGFSLLTYYDGTFYLPSEMYEGEWQIVARFPYYSDAYGTLEVFEGGLKKPVELKLRQLVSFDISVDRSYYFPGETIHIIVTITNLTHEPVTFESEKFPLFSVCLARDFEPVYGGIYEGEKPISTKLELKPNEVRSIEIFWDIPENVIAGEYQVFCAPVDSKKHPAYFNPAMKRLQIGLLKKLPYLVVKILP